MSDIGEIYTDEQIKEIEKRIKRVYSQANKEIKEKTENFISQFERLDKEKRKQVRNGTLSKEDYDAWKEHKIFESKIWQTKQMQCTNILTNSNKLAMDIINESTDGVFIQNANFMLFDIEKQLDMNLGFAVYDTNTVKRLIVEEPKLLPKPKVDVPKDKAWNMQKINNQLTQSIIQGESIYKLRDRLQNVIGMNQGNLLMHARTMMTGAQNAGRLKGMRDARDKGISLKKEWMSAHDGHTREMHLALDGEMVGIDEPFEVGGYEIMYPGDPDAEPAMVYNCRCTMVADLLDEDGNPLFDLKEEKESVDIEDFEDWIDEQEEYVPIEIDGLKNEMGTTDYYEYVTMIDNNENQDIKQMYLNYGNDKITYEKKTNGGFYSPSQDKVVFSYRNHSDANKYSTLAHECGHMFDTHMAKDDLLKDMFKETNLVNEKCKSFMGEPIRVKVSNTDVFLEAMRRDKENLTKMRKNKEEWADVLKDLKSSNASAGVQDAMDGFFGTQKKGELNWGHGDRYYNRGYNYNIKGISETELKDAYVELGFDASSQAKAKKIFRDYETSSELWANICSAETVGGKELEYMEKYMPNSLNAFREIINGVNDGGF